MSISRFAHRTLHQVVAHSHEAIIAVAAERVRDSSILVMLGLALLLLGAFALQSAMEVTSAE